MPVSEAICRSAADAGAEEALGKERLAKGDAAGAIACFTRALGSGLDLPVARRGLAVSYALCGRVTDLARLMTARCAAPTDRLVFLQGVLLELVGRQAWSAISDIAAAFAVDPHLRAVAIYYAGCAALARQDSPAAFACFEEFKAIVLPRHHAFPLANNEDFNLIFRQACLIEPPDCVRELAGTTPAAIAPLLPNVSFASAWRDGRDGPVFVCCCDGRYFRRFAAELCQSVAAWRPDAVIHFHIAVPQAADLELAHSLTARHPALVFNLTLETAPRFTHPVYYTCNRFLVAPLLLERYARPLFTLDADSVLLGDLQALIDAASGFDFACFHTGRIEPASVFQATIMHFAASAGAMRLLDVLSRLVTAKFGLPPVLSWMLDQAALFSAIRYAEIYAPDIRIGDFTRATGRDMRSFIGALGTMEEKRRLMSR